MIKYLFECEFPPLNSNKNGISVFKTGLNHPIIFNLLFYFVNIQLRKYILVEEMRILCRDTLTEQQLKAVQLLD